MLTTYNTHDLVWSIHNGSLLAVIPELSDTLAVITLPARFFANQNEFLAGVRKDGADLSDWVEPWAYDTGVRLAFEYDGAVTAPVVGNDGYACGDTLSVWAQGSLPRMSVQGERTLWQLVSQR